MQRIDALRSAYPDMKDDVVVTIMGAVAAELYSLGHRANFFYLQHAMGLASSMGLGLALAKPEKRVVVFDGDGSLLMNLGTLSTLAWYAPKNLIHVVFDNQSLLSVGGFPTATSAGSDLAGIAQKSGYREAMTARSIPRSIRCVAKLCRSVRGVMSGRRPARVTASLTILHTSWLRNLRPLAVVRNSGPRLRCSRR